GEPGRWGRLAVLVLLIAAGCLAYRRLPQITGALRTGARPAASQPVRAVPVLVATAQRGNLPIYLDGLGTVTAFRTATVRSRVDGLLVNVNFVEGQTVKEGDLLAEIDVRPYQADLDSKIAAESQASAQVDMARITYDHLKELMPEHSASPIEFKQAEATLKQ